MIDTLTRQELANHRAKYPEHFMRKFSETPEVWEAEALQALKRFRLDSAPGLRLLDLGSGYGYFLKACRAQGHEAVGVDVPDEALCEAAEILDAPFIPHRIEEGDLLPKHLGTFDVVTMMGVNLRGKKGWWNSTQYRKLWQAVAGHLVPGGAWIVQPNQGSHTAHLFSKSFWEAVVQGEGRVEMHQSWVEIQRPRGTNDD